MTDARHTPPGDRSFASSVARHLLAGAALVVVVALVFWGIGRFRAPTGDGPVISAPSEAGTTDPAPVEPTASPTPAITTGPTAEPTSPSETLAASPTPSPEPTAGERSSISVQVLDATGGDGARMQDVVDQLRELGYRVVATARAVRLYERSTVFFTEGHREDAVMIREDIPALSVVEEKPDNLSDSVEAHVVVGEDYPES